MKGFMIFLVGAVVGGIAVFVLSSALLTGIGAGVGIATGLQAGACLTVEAAKDKGLITSEQVDEILIAAVEQFASDGVAGETAISGGDLECEKVVAELKETAKKTK